MASKDRLVSSHQVFVIKQISTDKILVGNGSQVASEFQHVRRQCLDCHAFDVLFILSLPIFSFRTPRRSISPPLAPDARGRRRRSVRPHRHAADLDVGDAHLLRLHARRGRQRFRLGLGLRLWLWWCIVVLFVCCVDAVADGVARHAHVAARPRVRVGDAQGATGMQSAGNQIADKCQSQIISRQS